MMSLTMSVKPVNSGFVGELREIRVQQLGTLPASDVIGIELYSDDKINGAKGGLDAATDLPPVYNGFDGFVSSGTYDASIPGWKFENLDTKNAQCSGGGGGCPAGTRNRITSTADEIFIVAVRISSTASTGTFGLRLQSAANNIFLTAGSTAGVASNNFAMRSATSDVKREDATIIVQSTGINAYYTTTGESFATQKSTMPQGKSNVGIMRLDAWTNEFSAKITSIRVTKTGSGGNADIKDVRLWKESDAIYSTSSRIDSGVDTEITNSLNASSFTSLGTALLTIVDPTSHGTIDISTKTYYITFSINPSASTELGANLHGVQITNEAAFGVSGAKAVQFTTLASNISSIVATTDRFQLQNMNKASLPPAATPYFEVPVVMTQGDTNVRVARLTLRTNPSDLTTIWQGPKLDRWSNSSVQYRRTKKTDVTHIKICMTKIPAVCQRIRTNSSPPHYTNSHKYRRRNCPWLVNDRYEITVATTR